MMRSLRKRIVWLIAAVCALAAANLVAQQVAQSRRLATGKKEDYTRPRPTRPIRPQIPSINRYQNDKVFLEHADSLIRPERYGRTYQEVKGNVKFRQGGMFMWCDSAFYYDEYNSLDAFSHVRMEQGDTLFAYADVLYYDGDTRFARLRCGPTERSVRLINRDVRLTTDSLDYNLDSDIGWYEYGGRIDDGVNTLTSIYGEYSPSTKEALFVHDVLLVNHKDSTTLRTDTLYYNTDTHIARIVSPTRIESPTDTILTRSGWYNTLTDEANLLSRSTILHVDSLGRVTTLEGDSIVYDKASRISRAYAYRDPARLGRPMVITDTARKAILIGGVGEYNDSTRRAWAADYPLLIEYSRTDTTFLRADTIESIIEVRKVWPNLPDSLLWRPEVRDSMMRLEARKLLGGEADSVAEDAEPPVVDPVGPPGFPGMFPGMEETRPVELRDSSLMESREFHLAKAFRRARFFRPDLQGVADSITFVEFDSVLYMDVKPLLWTQNRQVQGNTIQIHFNDSTADRVVLPDYGVVGEFVGEDFYNQLAGKKMVAFLEEEKLKRLEVDGNVETIFLPMENDSTYNKLVNAESSMLSADFADGEIEKLKMWPEVSGTVTPLFMVKDADKLLSGFEWFEELRPRRAWYGGSVHWDDELGEVPEALERYFYNKTEGTVGRRTRSRKMPGLPELPAEPTDAPPASLFTLPGMNGALTPPPSGAQTSETKEEGAEAKQTEKSEATAEEKSASEVKKEKGDKEVKEEKGVKEMKAEKAGNAAKEEEKK